MRRLTDEQRAQLQAQYESVGAVDSGESERVGEHILLVALIQAFGFAVHSFEGALRIAERLLWGTTERTDDDYADQAYRSG
jgi:hypothetical protein